MTAHTSLLSAPLEAFELRLREVLRSKVEFIELIGEDLVTAGGKRFRPAMVFLASRALGDPDPREVDLAVAVELLHSATLLHDDLIDDAETRRGKTAAFRRYGNAVSVLSGDFMLSRVLRLLSDLPQSITAEFAETSMRICEGEVLQFQVAAYGDYSLENYFEIITAKTAVLIASAVRVPALLTAAPAEYLGALDTFGLEYGRAFQIQDDLLDLTADPRVLGKPIGGDLREGKATLPLLYLFETEHEQEARSILDRRAAQEGDVERVRDLAEASGALERAREELRSRAARAAEALRVLPPSPARAALEDMAWAAAERVR
ncbi:octaprenyl-diphosphate synthase [Deinobacterium chartae]|uniref:Octaprenyl-diphosphate synthase n=1 Tax=Deinobacterium chartae TaxID=521158 RepID=A0A841HXF1_9DEIO|nr:polyprenyl synthetase family protein [Deinobacterium chartae]MBB6097586.1 octaprenyl-diphosphate synthase [Deinobacterium chartae]